METAKKDIIELQEKERLKTLEEKTLLEDSYRKLLVEHKILLQGPEEAGKEEIASILKQSMNQRSQIHDLNKRLKEKDEIIKELKDETSKQRKTIEETIEATKEALLLKDTENLKSLMEMIGDDRKMKDLVTGLGAAIDYNQKEFRKLSIQNMKLKESDAKAKKELEKNIRNNDDDIWKLQMEIEAQRREIKEKNDVIRKHEALQELTKERFADLKKTIAELEEEKEKFKRMSEWRFNDSDLSEEIIRRMKAEENLKITNDRVLELEATLRNMETRKSERENLHQARIGEKNDMIQDLEDRLFHATKSEQELFRKSYNSTTLLGNEKRKEASGKAIALMKKVDLMRDMAARMNRERIEDLTSKELRTLLQDKKRDDENTHMKRKANSLADELGDFLYTNKEFLMKEDFEKLECQREEMIQLMKAQIKKIKIPINR